LTATTGSVIKGGGQSNTTVVMLNI